MISFRVEGRPGPKGSKTIGRRKNGSRYVRESSSRVKPWEEAVAEACPGFTVEPPYAVELEFICPRPKRPTYPYPVDGDVDKFARATLDGLANGRLLADDKHVTDLHPWKRYAVDGEPPGCVVHVRTLS